MKKKKERNFQQGLRYVFLLLRYRERSEYEIRTRLKKKQFAEKEIEEICNYLKSHNLINDQRFLKLFINDYITKAKGILQIKNKLQRLGFEPEIIEDAFRTNCDKEVYQESFFKEYFRLKKKYLGKKDSARKIRQALYRRGYEWDFIQEKIGGFNENR